MELDSGARQARRFGVAGVAGSLRPGNVVGLVVVDVAAVRELLVDTLTGEEFEQLGAISEKVLAAQGIKVVLPNVAPEPPAMPRP